MTFIVVDTEGTELLREIAILDERGTLLYEAIAQEYPGDSSTRLRTASIHQIVRTVATLAHNQRVICHFVKHDQRILKDSFRRASFPWEKIEFECTWELAQHYFPGLPSYSLEYLSRYLTLQVDGKYFNPRAAHSARYDARFTHQLYLKLMDAQTRQALQDKPNPFSSRVDTPFQQHPDFKPIYQDEFVLLKSVLTEIRQDANHQSRGVVVIGVPGSGKTHLMMRLAQELLQVNRLLFIRQPNNPDTVLYHIYTRILESFVEPVPANGYTQLENLLAHSFVKIIGAGQQANMNQRGRELLAMIQDDPLNLYRQLTNEAAANHREFWRRIEGRVSTWWANQYGVAGFAPQIIRGIIKFCSYREPRRKAIVSRWLAAQSLEPNEAELIDLPNWGEEMSREEFSLQAVSVFSRLSLLDEPLIIVFDQLEGLRHNEQLLRHFGFAITELFTHVPNSLIIFNLFPDRWQHFQTFFDGAFIDRVSQYQVVLNRPSNEQILGILTVKLASLGVTLDSVFTTTQLNEILRFPSIRAILNQAAAYYHRAISGDPSDEVYPASGTQPVSQKFERSDSTTNANVEQRLLKLEQSFSKLTQLFEAVARTLIDATGYSPSEVQEISPSSDLDSIAQQIEEYLSDRALSLEASYNQPQIITDNDDLGKLLTIVQAFQERQSFDLDQLRLGKKVLPEHLVIDHGKQREAIAFLGAGGAAFTHRIANYNELVLTHPDTQFYLFRDERHGPINGNAAKQHIASLNNAANGHFVWMDRRNRVTFDLIYSVINDIQNQDVEFPLRTALACLVANYPDYWLIQLLT